MGEFIIIVIFVVFIVFIDFCLLGVVPSSEITITTKIKKARRMVKKGKIETDSNTWGYRDFITSNIVIDEEFRIVEIDLRDYDLSEEKVLELRKDIFENKYPYASIVRIKTKDKEYNYTSFLFDAISEGNYFFSFR